MFKLNLIDKTIIHFDSLLKSKTSINNPHPGADIVENTCLNSDEKLESIRMMRINHSGEICAQALYHGQALFARNPKTYYKLMHAADEEKTHLSWCKQRLTELNARVSLLNPFWYCGSFAIGTIAGLSGDKLSMGFIAETEYQVSSHLSKHLAKISPNDLKSRAILEQMREDEMRHATTAKADGAQELPPPVKTVMRFTAKILTSLAARI